MLLTKRMLFFLISFFSVVAVHASPANPALLELRHRREVSMPIGYYDFCRTHGFHCRNFEANADHPTNDEGRVEFSPLVWAELNEINSFVNKDIAAESDWAQYGRKDLWVVNPPSHKGDCEDYVLTKLYALIEKGWPSSALVITLVKDPQGQEHAVLLARTSRADFILDNLSLSVTPWNQRDFTYVKLQSPEDGRRWIKLN